MHTRPWVGIDVSSAWLDVAVGATRSVVRVPNDETGFQMIMTLVQDLDDPGFIFESTGFYHRGLMEFLADHARPATLLQPKFLKHFRKSGQKLAKTDVLDAQLLARYGEVFQPRLTVTRSASLRHLADLLAFHRQLGKMVRQARNHQRNPHDHPRVRTHRHDVLVFLEAQITTVVARMQDVITEDPVLRHRQSLLCSVPAIGPVISATMLAGIPELGSLTRKQVAALAGLAPVLNESGKKAGLVTIKDGRKDVRSMMVLAARHPYAHAIVVDHRTRMLTNCACYREAMTATARWFLCVINAMIRDNLTWKELDIVKASA